MKAIFFGRQNTKCKAQKTGPLALTGAQNAESCSPKGTAYSQVIKIPTQHVSAKGSNDSTLHVVASSSS